MILHLFIIAHIYITVRVIFQAIGRQAALPTDNRSLLMATNDLRKWVTSNINFYEILGLNFEVCSENELRRAYRKTALKYHPDKAGANFDQEKYEIFQAAYEVLSDPSSKAQYDQYRQAMLQRQRANEMFEGRRKQMKEDLESREKNGMLNQLKRSWNNELNADLKPELKKFTEEGRKRRAARTSLMAEKTTSSPVNMTFKDDPGSTEKKTSSSKENEEDEVERLERMIKEAKELKAKRKAEKKARKSGVFVSSDIQPEDKESRFKDRGKITTPKNYSNNFGELSIDEKSSYQSNFSFKTSTAAPIKDDFTLTMARLKAAGKARTESESNK